jgi:hypothetical protein
MLEMCQILLIFLALCGVGIVLMARAALAQLAGAGVIALEGCVRVNVSWYDEAAHGWPLLSWNSAHRPPPGEQGALVSCAVACFNRMLARAVGVSWGALCFLRTRRPLNDSVYVREDC